MENFPEISLFPRLSKIGKALGRLATGPHQLASHGEHFLPDGSSLIKVTPENVDILLPPLTLWDDMGNYHDL